MIRREDIDQVRARTDIREIVEGYVTLKRAGVGSFKGLCPFHDERTPSFHVRPQLGTYHCFGCGESGDVYAFLMATEHTSFTETVERLAARIGYTLHYEGGSPQDRHEAGLRRRLLDAHSIAAEFFEKNLYTAAARDAQQFLGARGFTPEATKTFGVGYAPPGWDNLLKHLRSRGFNDKELRATGMFSEGNRGLYDRFRGRIIWPIRNLTGETVGFGARRLFEDDKGPKYLNTPETQLYKKSQVLYGLDLAKKQMAKSKQVVIVEGYTDVMAAHLAGVSTAVATCGTAFGPGHIQVVRRMITDDGAGGEIIFTFDGDAAGQKAALAAFAQDQRFVAQTFVAVAEDSMDPCDLRLHRGDAAVRSLVASRRPLFEFAIDSTLKNYDLATVEGRVLAMRAVAPIIAGIKDPDLRPAYARKVSGQLGVELDALQRTVAYSQRTSSTRPGTAVERARGTGAPSLAPVNGQGAGYHVGSLYSAGGQGTAAAAPVEDAPDTDPAARLEKIALAIALQHPNLMSVAQWQEFARVEFRYEIHKQLARGIIHAASQIAPAPGITWLNRVREGSPEQAHPLLARLSVTDLPVSNARRLPGYIAGVLNALEQQHIAQQKAGLMMRLQQLSANADGEEYARVQRELLELEVRRRAIRTE